MSTHLLIDVSCLAWRSFHAMGDLSYGGVETGVTYGVFRTVLDLMDVYGTSSVAWCFDRGHDKRTVIYPDYKKNRKQPDREPEELEARADLHRQIYRLRTKYLPGVGFKNIFWQDDYEADDVIASICQTLTKQQQAVIVSSDQDLYQLLTPRVSIWNPATQKAITNESFREKWSIDPFLWADVKAIAGCGSDGVPGVVGVGEKTAIKHLCGQLKDTTKAYKSILSSNNLIRRNLRLVRLPMDGIERFELSDDEPSQEAWERVMDELGMRSLRGRRVSRVRKKVENQRSVWRA